jgi:O-antigen/teichoic acid export membrane protein
MSTYSKLQDQPLALNHLVHRSLNLLYWLIAPTIALMATLSPWWVPAIYGRAWLPMVDIMFLLAIPFMVTAGYTILATVLSATGAVKPAARFQAVYNALYWLAALILIPKLEHLGLPAAEWVALVAGAILLANYRRHCGPLRLKGIAVKLALSGAAVAVGWRLAH